VLSTSSNTSGAWNIFYDGSSTATGTSAAVFSNGPTLVTPALGAATATTIALPYSGSSTSVGTLSVGGATSIMDTGLMATFVGSAPTYTYQLTQNTSSGVSSYTTITAANNGYASYVSMGVNSTTYSYTSAGFPNNAFSLPNANFIEADNGDLTIGTWTNNPIHFVVNGQSATSDSLTISSSTVTVPSLTLTGSLTAASSSGTSGQLLQSTGTGVQWATIATKPYTSTATSASLTAVAFNNYMINTASAVTVTLPASPALGDEIRIIDATGSAATNNITVNPNGLNLMGSVQNLAVNVNYGIATVIYTGSTYGWKVA